MAEYLVELYVRHDGHGTARRYSERVEQATSELTRQGSHVLTHHPPRGATALPPTTKGTT